MPDELRIYAKMPFGSKVFKGYIWSFEKCKS